MSRTSRLFMLLDALRGHRRPVTATRLARDLSVSLRTIYRDIGTLVELGAPIDGEAGMGYVLRTGFFLPPLMFDEDELEALVLGARWVEHQGDAGLARAAASALAKIATATPRDLRDGLADAGLWAPVFKAASPVALPLQPIREAIRREYKVRIAYVDKSAASSERVVWPIALAFMDQAQMMAAWCELRQGFRHFRVDRIREFTSLRLRYPTRRLALFEKWQAQEKIRLRGAEPVQVAGTGRAVGTVQAVGIVKAAGTGRGAGTERAPGTGRAVGTVQAVGIVKAAGTGRGTGTERAVRIGRPVKSDS